MLSLRPYQTEAAAFLGEHPRAMVLAPVGAGKTAITLTAMQESPVRRWLVLAPKRVAMSVWPAEARKWAPNLDVAVAVGPGCCDQLRQLAMAGRARVRL